MEYQTKIKLTKQAINNAEYVLIGGGSGFSTAAGLSYSGKRFRDNFKKYIDKYKITDMYSAGFYPFKTQEEKWGYWCRHIWLNRYSIDALPLYNELFNLIKDKQYFVITTNADHQFYKAGFLEENIFSVQGDY